MKVPERSRLPDTLEIPGLYPRRRRLPQWPLGLWLVVLAVAAIPIIGAPAVVLARYTTSDASFCLTCHASGETPDQSIASAVHPAFNRVTCVDCHARPGQVVFEGYAKGFMAEPERVNSNCIRCHPGLSDRTEVNGFKFNVLSIRVNHRSHLERGATCVSCHANIAHDPRDDRTNRPAMESCYTCHQRSTSCVKCHEGGIPAAGTGKEAVGRRPVAPPPIPTARTTEESRTTGAAAKAEGDEASRAVAEGKLLYGRTCAACHGPDGDALPSSNLKSRAYLENSGREELVRATAAGKGGMPPFGAARGGPLQDAQVEAIVDYLLAVAR